MSQPSENTAMLVCYDAELIDVDSVEQTLTFRHAGRVYVLHAEHTRLWHPGSVGRLTLWPNGEFQYRLYADPRLRRDPSQDDLTRNVWGWRLGDLRLQVARDVLPGLNGAVVSADLEPLTLPIPREFREWCAVYALTPEDALKAFIADVCGLHNLLTCPREDGYSSLGSDERLCARVYWNRAHAWRTR